MDRRFSDYLTQYKANCSFTETEREQTEVCGVRITVTLYEYDTETEHRDRAEILMEKDGLRYGCEGIERTHWGFFPVTVDGRPYILFSIERPSRRKLSALSATVSVNAPNSPPNSA